MNTGKLTREQLTAWMLAALTLPLAAAAAESGWMGTILWSGISLLLYIIGSKTDRREKQPLWLAGLQIGTIVWLLALSSGWLMETWPIEQENNAVAWILLALSALGAGERNERPAACGCILWRVTAVGTIAILICGIWDTTEEWKLRTDPDYHEMLPILLLVPLMGGSLQRRTDRRMGYMLLGICVLAITIGIQIPPGEPIQTGKMLTKWVSGICVAGKPRRLEVMLSMLMTAGWYCLLSLELSMIGTIAQNQNGNRKIWIWGAAVLGALTAGGQRTEILYIISIIIWIGIPLLQGEIKKKKKIIKRG